MAVIEERMQGKCKIIVSDDSIVALEEVQGIIDRTSKIVLQEELRLSMAKNKDETA